MDFEPNDEQRLIRDTAREFARKGHDPALGSSAALLDERGFEINRDEFMRELLEWHAFMLYIGDGYVPLTVAVLTA